MMWTSGYGQGIKFSTSSTVFTDQEPAKPATAKFRIPMPSARDIVIIIAEWRG